MPLWGFLIDRIDHRIAVSERARESQSRWLPGDYEVIPNGVLVPPAAPAGDREHRIVFAGRQEPRKGLQVLLRAWPEIRRRSGLRLTVAGADPLAVRLLLTRLRVPDDGIDVVGFLSQDELTETLLGAKALVAPSIGQESFGMVLTRAFACALPAVASDIPGYREVLTPDVAVSVEPNDPEALADAVCALVDDEPRREAMGRGRPRARRRAVRVAGDREAARGGLRERDRNRRRRRPAPREVRAQGLALGLGAGGSSQWLAFVLAVVVLWWRGPDWGSVLDAFRLVIWSWIILAFALNVVSTLFRALSWRLTVGTGAACRSTSRSSSTSSRRSASACSRTRSCRAGSASSPASRRFAGTFRMRRPERARRSSARSSPIASSTSCRRRSSSSGCS